MALRRIQRELKDFMTNPPKNCSGGPLKKDNLFHWNCVIVKGCPYEDGFFFLDVHFPVDYPFKPMSVKFLTKIYHPGVDKKGRHCIDILDRYNWSPALNIIKVMQTFSYFISDPGGFAEDPMLPSIARVYKTNRHKFNKTAKEWTRKYADGPEEGPKLGPTKKEIEHKENDWNDRFMFLCNEMKNEYYGVKEEKELFFRISGVWENDLHIFSSFMCYLKG